MPLSTIDDKNLKDALSHGNDSTEIYNNNIIILCTGMILDFSNIEHEIVQVADNCVIGKSSANDEEIEFRDFSVALSTRAEKLE